MTVQRLFNNTLYNSAAKFWLILIGFLLTPFIVRRVGIELFGLWAVISIMIGTFGMFDLGIRTSFVKYISEYHARNDIRGINEVVNTGFVYYSLFGLAVALITVACKGMLFRLFRISPALAAEAGAAYYAVIAAFILECAIRSYGATLEGLQRYDVKTGIEVGVSIAYAAAVLILLSSGYGFLGFVGASVARTAAESALAMGIGFRLLPGMAFRPGLANRRRFRTMFSFGFAFQVARWAEEVIFHLDKLIVGVFLNMRMVTFYQLGTGLCNRLRLLPSMLITPVFPYTSDLSAREEHQRIFEIYTAATRYMIIFAFPVFAFLFLRAHAVMQAWMGPGFDRSAEVIRVLAGSYCINCVMGAAVTIAGGIGAVRLIMVSCILVSAANIICTVSFVMLIGFIGVALGTSLSLVAASIFFWAWFHRLLGRPLIATLWPIARGPLIAVLTSGAALVLLGAAVHAPWQTAGRPGLALILSGELFFFVALYGLLLALTGYLTDADLALVRRLNALWSPDE